MRRILSTALALGVMSLTSSAAVFAEVSANTLPELNKAVDGTVNALDDKNLNVRMKDGNGTVGQFYWKSFNVGKDATVNFEFTGHDQTALNRVDQAGGMSQIYGHIKQSGCMDCGYEGTGKVILLNPNGVLFGDGANVNLNSFTVSTFDGVYDKDTRTLQLQRNDRVSKDGIVVDNNAQIYGDKNIALVSDKVQLLKGSRLTTNGQFGKIKIVTADGVHFKYANTGSISSIPSDQLKSSNEEMILSVEGNLNAGHIDLRNMSKNENSKINLKGATLKATKAVQGNDGKIWLTAENKVLIEDSNLTTDNYSAADTSRAGGEIKILAGKKVSINNSKLSSVDKINIESQQDDVVSGHSIITAPNDITIKAGKIASVQQPEKTYGIGGVDIDDVKDSKVESKNGNITIQGGQRAQVLDSYVVAGKKVNINGQDMAWTRNSIINTHDGDVNITGKDLLMKSTSVVAVGDINVKAENDINTENFVNNDLVINTNNTRKNGNINLESTKGNIALKNLEGFSVYLAGDESTINLKAGKDVSLNTDDSDLDDMGQKVTIEAGKDIHLTSSSDKAFNVDNNITFKNAQKIYIEGKGDVTVNGNMNNIQTNLKSGKDLTANLQCVGARKSGLVAEAKHNMDLNVTGDLSVAKLISGNDMDLNASGKVLSSDQKTTEKLLEDGDSKDRAYIEVGGTFTTNKENPFNVSKSAVKTDDGQYNQRHHIEFGDNQEEKILLVNKRPVDNKVTDPTITDPGYAGDIDPDEPGKGGSGSSSGTGSDTGSGEPSGQDPVGPGGQGGGDDHGSSTTPSEGQDTEPTPPTDCQPGIDPDEPTDEVDPATGINKVNALRQVSLSQTSNKISSYLVDVKGKKVNK